MSGKHVTDLPVTTNLTGSLFEATIPDGIGGYLSRQTTFETLQENILSEASTMQEETLVDSGSGDIVVGDNTINRVIFIEYSILRGTILETGRMVITNKADTYLNREMTSSDDAGITFTKSISGANIRLSWTDDLTDGNNCDLILTKVVQNIPS